MTGTKSASKKSIDPFSKKDIKETEEPRKNTYFDRILTVWSDEHSVLRLSWVTILSIVISFIAAGVFYAIEHKTECQWNYAQSLWFVNTISTTIGYGTIAPCTSAGKAVSVVFACIGIPVNLVSFSNIGILLSRLLNFLWVKLEVNCLKCLAKCRKKNKTDVQPAKHQTNETDDDNLSTPLSLAIIVTCLWFVISAMFFTYSEPENMTFGNAFYFMIISVTTIGFGDVTPKNYNLVVIQFFFVIIGITLFSMLINLVLQKLDRLNDSVEIMIDKEYAQAQSDGVQLQDDSEKAARDHVRHIMHQQKGGSLLQLVMGKNMENRLVEDYLEKARKVVVETQTDNIVHDKEIMAVPFMINVETQTDTIPIKSIKDVKPKLVPKFGARRNLMNLSDMSKNSDKEKELNRTNDKL